MNEIYKQTFDVGAVVILISHDHYGTVPQVLNVLVLSTNLYTKNLNQILDLRVLHDLLVGCFSDIQKFTSQWENTIVVSTHDFNTSQSQRFS